jgi:hypothetical protein
LSGALTLEDKFSKNSIKIMVFLLMRKQGDMIRKLIIYKITNLLNGKIYIGQDSRQLRNKLKQERKEIPRKCPCMPHNFT